MSPVRIQNLIGGDRFLPATFFLHCSQHGGLMPVVLVEGVAVPAHPGCWPD